MKLLTNIIRVLTGLLFVFSGFIKLNDPVGFSIKLEEYFIVFSADLAPKADTLVIEINNKESGLNESYTRVLRNEPERKISYRTSAWEHVEIKSEEGKSKSYYDKTTLFVLLDGQELLKKEIEKSDAAPANFEIVARVGETGIYNKSIVIYNNKDITGEELIITKQYVKEEGWFAKLIKYLIPFTLLLAFIICVAEILLGIALLIGWKRNLILWLLALMILFFTFLTWYSAYYNKVTDCGCFGNAIPLTPWESFVKDLLLCGFILLLIILRKYIKPVFSAGFSWKLLLVISILSAGFAFYCWYYLPVFNFLKFAKGNNIEQLTTLPAGAKQEKREMMFIYTKDGRDYDFTFHELSEKKIAEDPTYKFKDRKDKVVVEGDKPEIHDFVMVDADGEDKVKAFFAKDDYKLLMVSEGLTSTRPRAMKKIAELAQEWTKETKMEFWALTSSSPAEAEAIRHEYQFQFKFYYGDNTNIKSIIRSNPGLLLFKKGTVIATWPSTNLPSHKEILRKLN